MQGRWRICKSMQQKVKETTSFSYNEWLSWKTDAGSRVTLKRCLYAVDESTQLSHQTENAKSNVYFTAAQHIIEVAKEFNEGLARAFMKCFRCITMVRLGKRILCAV